jgi:hypothetical protein
MKIFLLFPLPLLIYEIDHFFCLLPWALLYFLCGNDDDGVPLPPPYLHWYYFERKKFM